MKTRYMQFGLTLVAVLAFSSPGSAQSVDAPAVPVPSGEEILAKYIEGKSWDE